jgi:hypothetical protein
MVSTRGSATAPSRRRRRRLALAFATARRRDQRECRYDTGQCSAGSHGGGPRWTPVLAPASSPYTYSAGIGGSGFNGSSWVSGPRIGLGHVRGAGLGLLRRRRLGQGRSRRRRWRRGRGSREAWPARAAAALDQAAGEPLPPSPLPDPPRPRGCETLSCRGAPSGLAGPLGATLVVRLAVGRSWRCRSPPLLRRPRDAGRADRAARVRRFRVCPLRPARSLPPGRHRPHRRDGAPGSSSAGTRPPTPAASWAAASVSRAGRRSWGGFGRSREPPATRLPRSRRCAGGGTAGGPGSQSARSA